MSPASLARRPGWIAALLLASSAAVAAQPIPLAAGAYCGPGGAKIVIDREKEQVTIDGLVCSFPVIGGGRMQSDLCATPDGQTVTRNVDFQVIGKTFLHDGQTYGPCGAAKAGG